MLLMIDNYDSFTYNLVQYLGELGADVRVARNDAITLDEIAALAPSRIVISPGPCTPSEAGAVTVSVIIFPPATGAQRASRAKCFRRLKLLIQQRKWERPWHSLTVSGCPLISIARCGPLRARLRAFLWLQATETLQKTDLTRSRAGEPL